MYSIDIKTYPSACDERGNMKLYRVMQAMQDCSELWLQSEPVFRDYFERNGMAQLLAYRQLDILRVPCYAENLRVSTSVYDVNPMFGYRNTCIYDSNNLPCYKSWGMGAFVNRQTWHLFGAILCSRHKVAHRSDESHHQRYPRPFGVQDTWLQVWSQHYLWHRHFVGLLYPLATGAAC